MKKITLSLFIATAALLNTAAAACNGHIVKHSMGTTCVPKDVQRIVTLSWDQTENVTALGINPVGVADTAGYNKWVGFPLPESTADLGKRSQPSLEKIQALHPDLIITDTDLATNNYQQLKKIAPTLVYDYNGLGSQYLQMRKNFMSLGKALGKEDKAEAVLRDLDNTLANIYRDLKRHGRADESFIITQAFTTGNTPYMRLFTPDSFISGVISRIGLNNSWDSQDKSWGFTKVGLETLASLKTDNFFYITQSDDEVFAAPSVQPLWNNLSFVKNNHAYPLNERTWTFGGPLSAKKVAKEVHDALLK